jgi:AcrR family transcriptional regulator
LGAPTRKRRHAHDATKGCSRDDLRNDRLSWQTGTAPKCHHDCAVLTVNCFHDSITVMSGKKRKYKSQLRAEQVEATRARIIDAAVQAFAPWATEVPFDKVADRARVSERTVYRHFPTQRDLAQAVTAYVLEHSGWDPNARAEDLGAMTARAFAYFGSLLENGEHTPSYASPDMQKLRGQRRQLMERTIGPLTKDTDPELGRGICAVFAGLTRVSFLLAMYEQWDLSGAEAGRAVEWAMNVLLTELRRGEKKGSDKEWDSNRTSKGRTEKSE